MNTYLHDFFFTVYPYICLAVFFMGSLARFDRDQYTWKSDSSQMLRAGLLRWGSNPLAPVQVDLSDHLTNPAGSQSVTASQPQIVSDLLKLLP